MRVGIANFITNCLERLPGLANASRMYPIEGERFEAAAILELQKRADAAIKNLEPNRRICIVAFLSLYIGRMREKWSIDFRNRKHCGKAGR